MDGREAEARFHNPGGEQVMVQAGGAMGRGGCKGGAIPGKIDLNEK